MRITKNQLRQIIQEELAVVLEQQPFDVDAYLQRVRSGDIEVKEGDTLWDLQQSGHLRGRSIDDVISYNKLDPNNLEIGSIIKLPPAPPAAGHMHIDSTLEAPHLKPRQQDGGDIQPLIKKARPLKATW